MGSHFAGGRALRCCIGVQMTFVPCLLGVFPWIGAGFENQGSEEEEIAARHCALAWSVVHAFAACLTSSISISSRKDAEDDVDFEDIDNGDTPATQISRLAWRVAAWPNT